MKKIQNKKVLILFSIIIIAITLFATKVFATDLPKLQNVRAEIDDEGYISVTWDNVTNISNLQYFIEFKNVEKGGGQGTWVNTNSYKFGSGEVGYNYSINVRVEADKQKGPDSDPITITQIPGKMKITRYSCVSTQNEVKIWPEYYKDADGYVVDLFNPNTNQYEFYEDIQDKFNPTTIKNLYNSTEHKIIIKAYKNFNGYKVYGKDAYYTVITNPKAPTNVNFKLVSGKVQLTWDNVNGATKYEVHKSYLKNGNFYKLQETTTNSFLDEKTYGGGIYFYKIKAIKSYDNIEYSSEFSNIVVAPFVAVYDVSIQSYNDKATIRWEKQSNISGYKIFRATRKDGDYEKIATIKKANSTSYTDKKIKAKKVYYYKVQAYRDYEGKRYYSEKTKPIQKTKFAQVIIKESSENNNKKTISLKWQKVSSVKGYEIYRANSKNGKYKKIATIKKNSTTKYTDKKGIGIGKLYYYKIRAYKNNDFGQYSEKKKQTTGSRKQQMNKIKLKPGTTGATKLDKEYKKIIKKVTKGKKSVYDKVKAVYKYASENMSHDKYHCKQFNGTFAAMMKVLGIENVYCARGYTTTTSGGWAEHTWCIIEINDTRYVFDTSIEKHIIDSTKKMQYSRFFKTEDEVAKKYKLSYYHSDAWPVQLSTGNFWLTVY